MLATLSVALEVYVIIMYFVFDQPQPRTPLGSLRRSPDPLVGWGG